MALVKFPWKNDAYSVMPSKASQIEQYFVFRISIFHQKPEEPLLPSSHTLLFQFSYTLYIAPNQTKTRIDVFGQTSV